MAYQIKKSRKILEELELCNDNGDVEKTLTINLDVDSIAPVFRKKQVALINAQKELKNIQKMGNQADFDAAYEIYGRALVDIFELTLGADNTAEILDFFENNYIEMCTQVVPFISEIIIPSIENSIFEKKKQMKNMHKKKRW
jgi:hypothetical protein